jgi:hypothetical protein
MMRSGCGPAHSSMCQSFHARTQARPSSWSLLCENTVPAKPAMSDGKHSEAWTPSRSMSATRASTSQQPRRISSKRAGSMFHWSLGRPEIAFSPICG